jgi:hypothetical protein
MTLAFGKKPRRLRNACKMLVGNQEIKVPLGYPDVGGRIIVKWVLEK